MVDWERVETLRAHGEDWDSIANDPKVGFHVDPSISDRGRALRTLYERTRPRRDRKRNRSNETKSRVTKPGERWTLRRVAYLGVPAVAVWAILAYLAPSPVGLLLPAVPYLLLVLAGFAALLVYALLRRGPKRWSSILRTTVIGGVVIGLSIAGLVALVGILVYGCPYLPPASSLSSEPGGSGWIHGALSPWKADGKPVVFFFGATWCPYCSASSWALWKALNEFGTTSGNRTSYSYGSPEPDQYTPEMVLAGAQLGPRNGHPAAVSFQVDEYDGPSDGVAPVATGCFELAYVSAYSGGALPFVVINGQYVHASATLVDPSLLSEWAHNSSGGAWAIQSSVRTETGAPWNDTGAQSIEAQTCWIMAFVVESLGASVPALGSEYNWSPGVTSSVWSDVNQTS